MKKKWYIVLQYLHYLLVCTLKGLHSELKGKKSSTVHSFMMLSSPPLCYGSLIFIWETTLSLTGTPALSQGQEKENPVFLITSVEIPLLEHVSLILACNSHNYTYTLTLTPNTFGQSSDLLGFNYKSNSQLWMDDGADVGFYHRRQWNSRVKCNGTDATVFFFITVNFIQNLIWLCNEMYVVNFWFCSFFFLLSCYTPVSRVFQRKEANSSAT